MKLISRQEFKAQVFQRDQHKCVICHQEGKDAHHILERKLWEDGGYYLDNGATLCSACHLEAEYTTISCQEIRKKANIQKVLLPSHLDYHFPLDYDKWGNPVLDNEQRLRGLFFYEEATQLALKRGQQLHLFTEEILHPQHSLLTIDSLTTIEAENLVLLDYNSTTELISLYPNNYHNQWLQQLDHTDKHQYLQDLTAQLTELPYNWRLCGKLLTEENNFRFEVFSLWDDLNNCLSWIETQEWAILLGLETIKILKEYKAKTFDVKELFSNYKDNAIVRVQDSFSAKEYRKKVFSV